MCLRPTILRMKNEITGSRPKPKRPPTVYTVLNVQYYVGKLGGGEELASIEGGGKKESSSRFRTYLYTTQIKTPIRHHLKMSDR
jgi:hypothetical protein